MNSLDFRYELRKFVRKVASYADAPIGPEGWDDLAELINEARDLLAKEK